MVLPTQGSAKAAPTKRLAFRKKVMILFFNPSELWFLLSMSGMQLYHKQEPFLSSYEVVYSSFRERKARLMLICLWQCQIAIEVSNHLLSICVLPMSQNISKWF